MRPANGSAIVFQTKADAGTVLGERTFDLVSRLRVDHFHQALGGRRHVPDDGVEQRLDADVQRSRGAEQRKHFSRRRRRAQARDELLLRERSSLEELFHQRFVGFGDHLDERFARGRRLVGHLRRDVGLGALAAAIGKEHVRFLPDKIDDAAKRFFLADGHLNRNDGAVERRVNRLQRPLEARALAIEAIDDDQARQPGLVGRLPCFLRLYLHARHGVDDHNRRIGDPQRRARVRQEVRHARCVDEVDFGLVPLGVGEAGRERVLARDLFVVVVGDRGAVVDFSEPVDRACVEQGGRCELSLSGCAVADQRHIPDVSRVIDLHRRKPSEAGPPARQSRRGGS